jgi:protein-disulfide isomerase
LTLSFFSRLALSAVVAFSLLAVAPAKAVDAPKPDRSVDMATLLKPGPLPELSEGDANGVPVVEYGSLTCPHCATFALQVLPKLKSAYIDTGKVHFIFREFSRNQLDVAAFLLARCIGDDKALAAIDLLFAQQEKWAFVDRPLEPLIAAMRPTGLSHDKAVECLKDNEKAQALQTVAKVATDLVKLDGTPTFIIGGKVYGGELTYDQLDAILQPLVK